LGSWLWSLDLICSYVVMSACGLTIMLVIFWDFLSALSFSFWIQLAAVLTWTGEARLFRFSVLSIAQPTKFPLRTSYFNARVKKRVKDTSRDRPMYGICLSRQMPYAWVAKVSSIVALNKMEQKKNQFFAAACLDTRCLP
jgi:hypothetical protein